MLECSIPKIIHQTGPSNRQLWHPLWSRCQQSWLEKFGDFDYKFWDDSEIDRLIRTEYPEYWKMYQDFPVHIMKIDFVRLCMMHKFGGIYCDLDVFCYQNFYPELTHPLYLLENPLGNDPIENSMMCSVPGHPFWIECMELTKVRYEYVKSRYPDLFARIEFIANSKEHGLKFRPYFVFYITGTNHLSAAARMTNHTVHTLPGILFNNSDMSYHPEYRTKHVHTGLWGKESQNIYLDKDKALSTLRTVPINAFDFYTDYTGGNYLMKNKIDWNKNETDEMITSSMDYTYL